MTTLKSSLGCSAIPRLAATPSLKVKYPSEGEYGADDGVISSVAPKEASLSLSLSSF